MRRCLLKFSSLDELTKWALESQALWLFLDYDGTLAEFAPTPAHVEPDPAIIRVLGALIRKPNLRLTIISGRRLPDVCALVPLEGILIAGSYGIELRTPDGQTVNRANYDGLRPTLDAIKPRWEHLIEGRQGFFLEDKGWTLALHGRWADDADAERILAEAATLASEAFIHK